MTVSVGWAPVRGTRLYYEVDGAGDWLVFAHGGEGTRVHWWRQVAFFRDHYRCLTYDARGYGSSPIGEPRSGGNAPRDDLLELLDHVGVDRAVLIGHSMGGMAVSGVAQSFPDRASRLVMSDTPFGFATEALSRWAAEMITKLDAGFEVMDHLFAPDFERRDPQSSYLCNALNRLNQRPHGPAGVEVYHAWRDQPVGDFSSFAVPSLFIVGAEDELTLPWLIRATAQAVPGAQLVEITGAGHSGYAEQPDIFNETLLRFCRS
jgi:pimeloyl-ACP methyl ester carboxylesterase